jgi:hypothetical protein
VAKKPPLLCDLRTFGDACRGFAQPEGRTQSAGHIRPMHWYVACRLVIEGGFNPEYIKPRPPFRMQKKGRSLFLHCDRSVATGSEATLFGGLKTKDVDVVVALPGIGPCVAISMKGTLNAFRNLTNRLEEAVGDCTNIHIAYPGLVYGFLHILRANREGPIPKSAEEILKPDPKTGLVKAADTALRANGDVTGFIQTYHNAMARLSDRKDLRDDLSRYEAVAILLISGEDVLPGSVVTSYPPTDSVLSFSNFFPAIYRQYDMRYVYGAPNLRTVTRRHFWHPESPALALPAVAECSPRISESDEVPIDEQDELERDGEPPNAESGN